MPEDKALLYYLCQNNAELSQIKRTMEEQFQCTKEMIQKILYRLESSPQAEMAPVPLTDETQLPKEFNTLIRKYNGALRKSQRMVKVYSWDNLDFRSVYVLPSLEISIELNDDLFFTPQPITEKDVREYVDRFIALNKFQESEKERFVKQASNLVDKGFVKGFLTLSLLLAIYKNEQDLPANKVALYQKCFEYIANTREKNKNLLCNSSTGRAYDWAMLDKLMENATFMELAQLGTPNNRDISRDAIDELMTGLYVQRFQSETECRTAIEAFLQFCADRTEVFVPSPNSNTEYRFFHRSFYEFFYANYIVTRTRFVEDTYLKLSGFGVDSELFELLVQLYNKNNPIYLRELIQYAFLKAEERFQNPIDGVSKAFDILVMLMQTADENDFLERFIRLFLERGDRISGFSLCTGFNMICTVFKKIMHFSSGILMKTGMIFWIGLPSICLNS